MYLSIYNRIIIYTPQTEIDLCMHSIILASKLLSVWWRLSWGGAGLACQEELLEQLEHHHQAQPPAPDHAAASAGAGGDHHMPGWNSVAFAGEPRLARPLHAHWARLRRPGQLLIEVLPQHVHLVLLGEPLGAPPRPRVDVVVGFPGVLGGREAPPVMVGRPRVGRDDEPWRRRREVRERELLGAALHRWHGRECEVLHHGCVCLCTTNLWMTLSLCLNDVFVELPMEVATSYLPLQMPRG